LVAFASTPPLNVRLFTFQTGTYPGELTLHRYNAAS
jgi:hypothetical protein